MIHPAVPAAQQAQHRGCVERIGRRDHLDVEAGVLRRLLRGFPGCRLAGSPLHGFPRG